MGDPWLIWRWQSPTLFTPTAPPPPQPPGSLQPLSRGGFTGLAACLQQLSWSRAVCCRLMMVALTSYDICLSRAPELTLSLAALLK